MEIQYTNTKYTRTVNDNKKQKNRLEKYISQIFDFPLRNAWWCVIHLDDTKWSLKLGIISSKRNAFQLNVDNAISFNINNSMWQSENVLPQVITIKWSHWYSFLFCFSLFFVLVLSLYHSSLSYSRTTTKLYQVDACPFVAIWTPFQIITHMSHDRLYCFIHKYKPHI